MKKTFARDKFTGILIAGTLASMVEYAGLLADNIIAGRMLGGDALAALGLINPFYTVMIFVAFLTAIGSDILICRAAGKADGDLVNQIFSQGLIMTVIAGLSLSAIYFAISGFIPTFLHIDGQTAIYATEYFRFICFFPVIQGLSAYLFSIIIDQGGETLCTVGGLLQTPTNIILSIFLCKKIGIQGISLASVLSNVLLIAILCLYFLKPHHILHFKPYFSAKLIPQMLQFSISDALVYLNLGLMEFLLNLYIVSRFSENYLIVFAVICNVIAFLTTGCDGLGEGISALIATYRAENNKLGINKTMRVAGSAAFIGGILVMFILLILAPQFPVLFGITDSVIISDCIFAIRIYAPAAFFYGIFMLMTSYYIYIDQVALSATLTTIYLFLMPVISGVLGGLSGKIEGVWVGLAISIPLSIVISIAITWCLRRGRSLPLYLNTKDGSRQFSYDEPLTKEGVMHIVDMAERDMTAAGLDRRAMFKTMNLIEETGILSISRNQNKSAIVEVTITIDADAVSLILRDNGSYSDATDNDAEVKSMEEYAAIEIIASHRHSDYFLTNGYNRTFYQIPIAEC